MNINSRIPKDFYKLFGSKYMEYYQISLMALYEESSQSYSILGLTEEECQDIINEKKASFTLDWSEEQYEEEGKLITKSNMASIFLNNLVHWGWLRRDYDETLNTYVVSFPDYSQYFVELFGRLFRDNSSLERESLLTVYSHLFTYRLAKEKDNEILKSALQTSKTLLQMLANMQEGIRGYFEELSKQRTFIGIQEVLVNEINNSDSRKYAILTTTDSFYRYKEEVKELIEENLVENEERKQEFLRKKLSLKPDSFSWLRNERSIAACEEAMEILLRINREFDGIERRYNRLIDQKRTFAKRAAARIRYILVEGDVEEDRAKALVWLLHTSEKKDEILEQMSQRFGFTASAHIMKERSFAKPRDMGKREFEPQSFQNQAQVEGTLQDFVVRPLYTRGEIQKFREENEKDGVFQVTKDTVKSVEDLEKLIFVWQEATEVYDRELNVELNGEFQTESGFRYSGFSYKKKEQNESKRKD